MFGCCVAGRLLQTNLQQVDETHALFELPAASTINHVCVFLLGTVPFPEGYGCTVHFHWPGKGFQLLGMLSNDKPSAIFRLRGTYTPALPTHSPFATPLSSSSGALISSSTPDVTAILGLSIEPLPDIAAQLATLPHAKAPAPDAAHLAERIVTHLFNYLSGFAPVGQGQGQGQADMAVPMALIVRWYESFLGKVRNGGVGFLERGE